MADEKLTDKYKQVTVELTAVGSLEAAESQPVSGWGDDANKLAVADKVVEIIVCRPKDGGKGREAAFGIRILEDGSIILTSYRSLLSTSLSGSNISFENLRPWSS